MKKLVLKLLGLDTLICSVDLSVELLRKENEELKNQIKDLLMAQEGLKASVDEVTEKVDGLEEFDSSQFVSEDEINDRIESYMNDNEYVTSSYVDDEIESKVSDAVESAVEDIDLEDKVKDVVSDMDKASFGDTEELKSIVKEQVKSFMLNSVKIDFIVR